MTLQEIKTAVDQGKTVCWINSAYNVIKDSIGQYFIICNLNDYCVGLTWDDGTTLNASCVINGDCLEFFIN
jgi:hypothetical protein